LFARKAVPGANKAVVSEQASGDHELIAHKASAPELIAK
jgi:hypothetical protein